MANLGLLKGKSLHPKLSCLWLSAAGFTWHTNVDIFSECVHVNFPIFNDRLLDCAMKSR